MAIDKDLSSITNGQFVWDEMITWFNHTVENDASFFIRKHEVGNLVDFINDLKARIVKLQKELDDGKANS